VATPTIRQVVSLGATTATTTVTTAAGTLVDDWLIAFHQTANRAGTELNTPTGTAGTWTAVGPVMIESGAGTTAVRMRVWRRKVTVAGAQTVTTSSGTAGQTNSLIVLVIAGADLTSPIDGTPATNSGVGGTSEVVGPTTPVGSDSLLVGGWGVHGTNAGSGVGYTAPASMVERADTAGVISANNAQMVATEALTVAGTTGTRTATTPNAASTGWVAILFAIKADSQVLTVTNGIPHTHTVGTAAVTPGDVTLTPTAGIAHTHPVGTARLDLNITSTNGIPHTHPVGLATVNPGISASSISHTHPVGLATVTRGPVSLIITNGIPHTHPMGAVTLLGSVLAPIGIPHVHPVGSATITTGPVNVTVLNGIPHSHPMGPTVVTRITTALTKEIVTRPKERVSYDLVMVARVPQANLPFFIELESMPWRSLKYAQKLSTPDTLDATIKVSNLTEGMKQRLRTPSETATELWLYRDGKKVFVGPLAGGSMQGDDLNLSANGTLAYLQWMYVRKDLIYKNLDQFLIVKGLIDQWQVMDYGHFGIDTNNTGISGVTLNQTYIRNELHEVYDRVMDLAGGDSGFDIGIDPVTRNLELWYPKRGIDRSTGSNAVIFDDRNVTDTNLVFSLGTKDIATEVAGVGTGSGSDGAKVFFSTFRRPELETKFGRVGFMESFRNVTSQAQNDSLTSGLLSSRQETLWIPGPNVRVTPDSDLDSYDVGDTVSYHLHNELDIQGAFRLLSREISVDENSNESVSVSFV
jgi:hypothetical protein